jgi:hypothetical protein
VNRAAPGRLLRRLALVATLGLAGASEARRAATAQTGSCPSGDFSTETPRGKPYTERLVQIARQLPFETRVVAIGDSIIGRWPRDQLTAVLGTPPTQLAEGGDGLENTTWILGQINPGAAQNVRIVVSAVGSANVIRDDACQFATRAHAYLHRLREVFPKAAVYVINVYQKGVGGRAKVAEVGAANAALKRYSEEFAFDYVDIHSAIARDCVGQENCALLEPNRVHPNAAGYQVISEELRRAMAK